MKTKRHALRHRALLAPLLCFAMVDVPAAREIPAHAEGRLLVANKSIALIDVIALPSVGGSNVEVLASAAKFDQAKLAEDGKLDGMDVTRLQFANGPALVRFVITPEKKVWMCMHVRGDGLRAEFCDGLTLELTTKTATRIAGVISGAKAEDSIRLQFDAPIQSTLTPVASKSGDG
jgi:hypothetical protein